MRLRDDMPWQAGAKRAIELGAAPDPRTDAQHDYDPVWLRELDALEPARPGDVWRITAAPDRPFTYTWRSDAPIDWVLVGYALWCPNEKCLSGAHQWTHARDCPESRGEGLCKLGARAVRSCWTWTGSIENSTLSAEPSLWVQHDSCGWHGYLRDGTMVPV